MGRYDLTLIARNLARKKRVDLGDVFRLFGGLMGSLGSRLGDMAPWDVDKAQGCGGWIVWQILGRYDLTNCVKPCQGKTIDLGDVSRPFGGLMGTPGVMAGGDGLLGCG